MAKIEDLPKAYDPKKTEGVIYELWEKSGFFNPDNLPKTYKKPFTILMPPPNANGALHIGHAVFVTLQDIMTRYKRMRGFKTLWLPGADHAGFETQVVYNKKLEKENRQFWKIPRERLYQEILEFTLDNKKHTENQLRMLGASCDWSREKFTLDPKIKAIVYETFKKLYKDGLLYRDNRLVNWCTKHQTTLSDLEVKWLGNNTGKLYTISYGTITIATVRPETMFADVAIAVHPKGKHKNCIGKTATIPLTGKKIPIIGDENVDENFGTGAVKVTPGIDFNDFEIGKRHGLPIVQIVDRFGKITETAPKSYWGKTVAEAREMALKDLEEARAIKKTEEYIHAVPVCYKCDRILEPQIMPQWYIAMIKELKTGAKSLRDLALEAIKTKKVSFVTKKFEKVFLHWMKNLRDWNISRQIVWGIPIPVWYCGDSKLLLKKMGFAGDVVPQVFDSKTRTYRLRDHSFMVGDRVVFENSANKKIFGYGTITEANQTTVGEIDLQDKKHWKTYHNRNELTAAFKRHYPDKKITNRTSVWIYTYEFDKNIPATGCGAVTINENKPAHCYSCGNTNLVQDPDVFDTWFSSGQWPFATLGFSAKGGQAHGKDFKTFYPTDVMETGYDILFFWVARMIMLGLYRTGKVPFRYVYLHGLVRDKDRQKMSKSKGNVIDPLGIAEIYGTDALRIALIIGNMPGQDIIISEDKIRGYRNFVNKIWNVARFLLINTQDYIPKASPRFTLQDRKIQKEFSLMAKKTTNYLEKFQFSHAGETLYHYLWHTFADKILEESKLVLEDKKRRGSRQYVLLSVFADLIKLLHPFIPFVTEEIYQQLPIQDKKETLMIENWPFDPAQGKPS